VSNFGDLAVVVIDNPGTWTQAEFAERLHPHDAERTWAALDGLGHKIVPEEPLWRPYDGNAPLPLYAGDGQATWWIRFFDYL
jgi:hypothetical protein